MRSGVIVSLVCSAVMVVAGSAAPVAPLPGAMDVTRAQLAVAAAEPASPAADPAPEMVSGSCGAPGAGSCCAAGGNGTPACEDLHCCGLVCESFPSCCALVWDAFCAAAAAALCESCCEVGQCDDGNPCTVDVCLAGKCAFQPAPLSTPCEADGNLCTLDHCDGAGECVTISDVVCTQSCPLCDGGCSPDSGLCPCAEALLSGSWSDDIWGLAGPNPYPDNILGVPGLGAVISAAIDIFLDVTVEIESLCVLDGSVLRVTQKGTFGPQGNLSVVGPEGILVQNADLIVGNGHTIDSSAGPVVIAAGGTYKADPNDPGPVTATLVAADIAILEGPQGGRMELIDSMTVACQGTLLMDGTGVDKKGSCTPPDLQVLNAAQVEVGGDFQIIHAASIEYASSTSLNLFGDFANHSVFPLIFNWTQGGLTVAGPTGQSIEAAGEDRGPCLTGFTDNFTLGTLEVADNAVVNVIDVFDNQRDGQMQCDEALYVNTLVVGNNAVLDTNGCKVYYNQLNNNGTIPGLGSDVRQTARADLNGDCVVNAQDLAILLSAWGTCPSPCPPTHPPDLIVNCAVDSADLASLLAQWGPVN